MQDLNSPSARDFAPYLHPHVDFKRHRQRGLSIITRGERVQMFDDEGNGYLKALCVLRYISLEFTEFLPIRSSSPAAGLLDGRLTRPAETPILCSKETIL